MRLGEGGVCRTTLVSFVFCQKFLNGECRLHIVMMRNLLPVCRFSKYFLSCIFSQPPQDITIEQCIDRLIRRERCLMDSSFSIDKTGEHGLHLLVFPGWGLFHWEDFCFVSSLVITLKIIWVTFKSFLKIPGLAQQCCYSSLLRNHSTYFAGSCLMFCLSEKIWHLHNVAHVLHSLPMFFQNYFPKSSNVFRHYAGWWPSWMETAKLHFCHL